MTPTLDTPASAYMGRSREPAGSPGPIPAYPNLAALAENFTISDRTFEFGATPSWAGHMVLGSATLDGFKGENPKRSRFTDLRGPGWGCDSYKDSPWWNGSTYVDVPSCIPQVDGTGPYRPSPVAHVPTIFDRNGRCRSLLAASTESLGARQHHAVWLVRLPHLRKTAWLNANRGRTSYPSTNVSRMMPREASPSQRLSIVTAEGTQLAAPSGVSTSVGDNYLGDIHRCRGERSGMARRPQIFLTWDYCGCYYDHVTRFPSRIRSGESASR